MDMVDTRPTEPAEEAPVTEKSGGDNWRLVLAGLAFLLAIVGQFYFKQVRLVVDGALFFLLAILAFAALIVASEATAERRGDGSTVGRISAWIRANRVRAALIVAGFVIAFMAFAMLRGKQGPVEYWDVFALWVLSFVCYGAAFVRRPHFPSAEAARTWLAAHTIEILVVGGLTAIALYTRLVDLGRIPNIVSGDEGRLGVLAMSVERGELNNMFSTIFGNSTLYIYVLEWIMRTFGWTAAMLRIASALGGALNVPALYLFGRRFFNRRIAFIAAALMTVSHIHLHFSRVAVAGGLLDALFATVALYFFLAGLEERSRGRLVLSALIMGLHLYFYMGARLVILLVPVYLLVLLVLNPKLIKENLPGLAAFAGMLLIVAIPMGYWAAMHADDFNARMNQTGIIQSGWLASESLKLGVPKIRILLDQFWQALLSINYYPAIAFYNAKIPMLDMLSGAMFVLGLAYSLFHFRNPRHLLLQGWFWAGVIGGGALVVQPAISVYRILIIFPVVCLFVGMGFDRLVQFGFAMRPSARVTTAVLTLIFVAAFSVINLRAYWVDYAPTCAYEDWSTRFASYMGRELGKAGTDYAGFDVGNGAVWYGIHPSVEFLSHRNPITNVQAPIGPDTVFAAPNGKAMFFFTQERVGELSQVERTLPGGVTYTIQDCGVPLITIYRVDRAPGS